jgi:tetratricopeptide (TPR) repeat protein
MYNRATHGPRKFHYKAMMSWYEGKHGEALEAYEEHLLQNPADQEARIARIWLLASQHRYEEVAREVTAEVAESGPTAELLSLRGWLLLAIGAYALATADLKASLDLDDTKSTRVSLATALIGRGRSIEALHLLEGTEILMPGDWLIVAEARGKAGLQDEQRKAYTLAAAAARRLVKVRYGCEDELAYALAHMDEFADAERAAKACLKKDAASVMARAAMMEVCYRTKDYEGVYRLATEIAALDPRSASAALGSPSYAHLLRENHMRELLVRSVNERRERRARILEILGL